MGNIESFFFFFFGGGGGVLKQIVVSYFLGAHKHMVVLRGLKGALGALRLRRVSV